MTENLSETHGSIYTIGHSNHELQQFLDLLIEHNIQVLVDVRSYPASRYAPHFNVDALKEAVLTSGIKYLFLGKELGGRPDGDEFYDEDGRVLYWKVAESPLFLEGIARLEKGIRKYRVAIMCSEEDPAGCHRHLLVGRVLSERNVTVQHIRGDGRVDTNEEIGTSGSRAARNGGHQPLLFTLEEEPEKEWKSIRSVLPKRAPKSSSDS